MNLFRAELQKLESLAENEKEEGSDNINKIQDLFTQMSCSDFLEDMELPVGTTPQVRKLTFILFKRIFDLMTKEGELKKFMKETKVTKELQRKLNVEVWKASVKVLVVTTRKACYEHGIGVFIFLFLIGLLIWMAGPITYCACNCTPQTEDGCDCPGFCGWYCFYGKYDCGDCTWDEQPSRCWQGCWIADTVGAALFLNYRDNLKSDTICNHNIM